MNTVCLTDLWGKQGWVVYPQAWVEACLLPATVGPFTA